MAEVSGMSALVGDVDGCSPIASVTKAKPRTRPRYPMRGRIHMFELTRCPIRLWEELYDQIVVVPLGFAPNGGVCMRSSATIEYI